MMLVSVILPNYNHAIFLEERIESILAQTYTNFELIILDDNSNDNSKDIILKYQNHPKVSHIVFNKENSGSTFRQWDKGLSLAKGNLIWIAESDDSCHSTLLEHLVQEFLDDPQLTLAYCSSLIIDADSNQKGVINRVPTSDYHDSGKNFIKQYLCHRNVLFNASSVLFRKDKTILISKRYESYKGSGDWLFWIELCKSGNISYCKKPLNYFRKHGSSVTDCCESNGIQQIEAKSIIDYMKSEKLISSVAAWKIKFDDLYEFKYDVAFSSLAVKNEVFLKWKVSRFMYMLLSFRHLLHEIKNLSYGDKN